MSFELMEKPDGMRINARTGEIQWNPLADQAGQVAVRIRVRDIAGLFDEQAYLLTVQENLAINNPPRLLTNTTHYVRRGQVLRVPLAVVDPDGDSVTLSLINAPGSARIREKGS